MATIGIDCQIILDGVGYWVEPRSYQVQRPRLRRASVTSSGDERYIDSGPGKRVWSFTVLALDDLKRYDGQLTSLSGQFYRDALVSSYERLSTLPFVDPQGLSWAVHFDQLIEHLYDLRTQLTSLVYRLGVELVEASPG